jgi:hypothetical protein
MRHLYVLFLLSFGLAAQAVPGQTGGNAPALKPEDLCKLEGRALNAATGEPLERASVTLTRVAGDPAAAGMAQALGAAAAGLPSMFSTSSDSTGRFAMKDLEPGSYRLQVSRAGFVSAEYGARGPSKPGKPVMLGSGQELKDLVIRLTPHGVVAGRIVDQDGEPVPSVMVQLLTLQYSAGKKQPVTAGSATTNDLGEYRAFGLAPGRYYISASMSLTAVAASMSVDRSAEPQPDEDYVATYYPGVTDSAAAAMVDVAAGAQVRGIDMTLAKRHTARIKGRVSAPAPASLLMLAPRSLLGALSLRMVRVDPKGEFEVRGLPPGAYSLSGSVQQSGKTFSATMPIDIGQGDIEGLTFSIGPGVTVAGRLQVDAETKADLSRVRVRLQPHEMGMGAVMGAMSAVLSGGGIGADSGKLGDDLSFRLPDISADRYDVTVTGLPDGFYVKAARSGDNDVLLSGLDVKGASPEPVEIVISPRAGQVSGSVQNPNTQQPAAQATVALVPQENERIEQAAYYHQADSGQDGHFNFRNLPPGKYKVFAWEDVESGAWMDPDFIRPVADKGVSVTVEEGGQETVDVKLIPADAAPEKQNGR